MEMFGRRNEEI
jgi:hypothetical protein